MRVRPYNAQSQLPPWKIAGTPHPLPKILGVSPPGKPMSARKESKLVNFDFYILID